MDKKSSEKRYITVLFSDLTDYTALTEVLGSEETQNLMTKLFVEANEIIEKRGGTIEHYFGDELMAIFGMQKANEDDVRQALRACLDLHSSVNKFNGGLGDRLPFSLSFHSGLETGFVVTGAGEIGGTEHGLTGQVINMAAHAANIAYADEILVGEETFKKSQHEFVFERLDERRVGRKNRKSNIYRLIDKRPPVHSHSRKRSIRSHFVGRVGELHRIKEAANICLNGISCSSVCICGEPGIGKSRLVEKFRESLGQDSVQWLEGHAYPSTSNAPFSLFMNLFESFLPISKHEETEQLSIRIREFVETLSKGRNLESHHTKAITPSSSINEVMSPESRKEQIFKEIIEILLRLTSGRHSIICFEDLHWADPSSLKLLGRLWTNFNTTTLFICTYRTPFSLTQTLQNPEVQIEEITLEHLSREEVSRFLRALLKTTRVSEQICDFFWQQTRGNPLYIEELAFSLLRSSRLKEVKGEWGFCETKNTSEFSSSFQGIISIRLDHLESSAKTLLQEAAVIGEAFSADILRTVTSVKSDLDSSISLLEKQGFIDPCSFRGKPAYQFRHAIIQEVIYKGLLQKQRKRIHKRVAAAFSVGTNKESQEICSFLAYHYAKGGSIEDALPFLLEAGQLSLDNNALEEAHAYFKRAYNLAENPKISKNLLMTTVVQWAFVFDYKGSYLELLELLENQRHYVNDLSRTNLRAMYYAWLGETFRNHEKLYLAYENLQKALDLAKGTNDAELLCHIYGWLVWNCADLGRFEEALTYGQAALACLESTPFNPYLRQLVLYGIGMTHYFRGDGQQTAENANLLLDHGRAYNDIRFKAHGHQVMAFHHLTRGDYDSAISECQKAILCSRDPITKYNAKTILAVSYISTNRRNEASAVLSEIVHYSQLHGLEVLGTSAIGLQSIASVAAGRLGYGLRKAKQLCVAESQNGSMYRYAKGHHFLGRIYMAMLEKDDRPSFSMIIRNLFFVIRNLPIATKMAEKHLLESARIANKIGSLGLEAETCLDLGRLYLTQNRYKSKQLLLKAASLFRHCNADIFLKQVESLLRETV